MNITGTLSLLPLLLMFTVIKPAQMMENHQDSSDDTDKIVVVSTTLHCDILTAVGYFSENSLLVKWLTVKADVKMKPGIC